MIKNLASKIFFVLSKKDKALIIAMLILMAITAVIEILAISSVMPFIASITNLQQVIDKPVYGWVYKLMHKSDFEYKVFLGYSSLFLIVISNILRIFANKKLLVFGNEKGAELAVILFQKYLEADYSFHLENNTSALIKNITIEVARYTQNVFLPLLRMISRVLFLILSVCFLLLINPYIALLTFCLVGGLYFSIFLVIKNKLSTNGLLISKENAHRFKIMNESFLGIKETKIMKLENNYINLFNQSMKQISVATADSQAYAVVPKNIVELLVFGGVITIILILMYLGLIIVYLPTIIVFLFVGYKAMPAMQEIYNSAALIRANFNAIENIEMINVKNTTKAEKGYIPEFSVLEVKNICFNYTSNSNLVLQDISFTIKRNSSVAIVGESGCGKSTLIDILLGLLKPNSGQIKLDGDMDLYKKSCWKDLFAFVPQSVHLIEGSILDNIVLGHKKSIDINRIHTICQGLKLQSLIDESPDGLYTNVGENGAKISGGQKQRIGIARALYARRQILILDEATSALDSITEIEILNSLRKLAPNAMLIMVTHSLEAVKCCEKVLFIREGQIYGQGSFQKLCQSNLHFKKFVELKNRDKYA